MSPAPSDPCSGFASKDIWIACASRVPRGDQFFVKRESVERYAEELRQIEAVAAIDDGTRHDAPQRAIARSSALERDTAVEVVAETVTPRLPEDAEAAERLKDENLILRIDNRAKEIAIAELNRRLTEDRDKFLNAMQDVSYKLGAAETRLAQLEASKVDDDAARQTTPERVIESVETVIIPPTWNAESTPSVPDPDPRQPEPRRSFFGRLFG